MAASSRPCHRNNEINHNGMLIRTRRSKIATSIKSVPANGGWIAKSLQMYSGEDQADRNKAGESIVKLKHLL